MAGSLKIQQGGTASIPESGYVTIWSSNTDDEVYINRSNGTVTPIGAGGGGGTNGTSGTSGTSGLTIPGANGTSGTSGVSGATGANGTSGTSGVNGATGANGTSGIDGTNGTAGTSGVSITGPTGASGTSGTSGTSASGGGGKLFATGGNSYITTDTISVPTGNNCNNILIGSTINTCTNCVIAIGNNITVGGDFNLTTEAPVIIGQGAYGWARSSVSIGRSATARNDVTIAIGALADGHYQNIAIGPSSCNTSSWGIALGVSARNTATNGAFTNGKATTVIGHSSCAMSGTERSNVIGAGAKICASCSNVLGNLSTANHVGSSVIGYNLTSVKDNYVHGKRFYSTEGVLALQESKGETGATGFAAIYADDTDNQVHLSLSSGEDYPITKGAAGYFGSFYDTTNQAIAVINTPQAITFSNTGLSNEVILAAGQNLVLNETATYNMNVTLLVENNSGNAEDVVIWLKLNGSDYPNSSHFTTIRARKSVGVPSQSIISFSFLGTSVASGDYVTLYWQGSSTDLTLKSTTGVGYPSSSSVAASLYSVGS